MRPDSKLCFDFSLPVDKSHLEELESEKEEEEVAKYCPTKENVKDAEPSPATAPHSSSLALLNLIMQFVLL